MCWSAERPRRALGSALLGLALAAIGDRVQAQEHETAEATAIRLMDEGLVALRSGQCALALSKLGESSRLAPRYPFLCRNAECADRCEPLRTATLQALRACQLAAGTEKEQRLEQKHLEAAAEAERLEVWAADAAQALLARLPHVVIRFDQDIAGLVVGIDGRELPHAQLGAPIPIDPGAHRVDATAPGRASFARSFEAAEASITEVDVQLDWLLAAAAPGSEPPAAMGGTMMPTGMFLMVGPDLSLVFDRAEGAEFALGGEVSLVSLNENLFWAGSYLDAVYSTQSEETRLSVGPELGVSFIGLDAGYLLKLGGAHGTQHGINLRPMLTMGVVTTYFRSAWLFGSNSDWSGELGVLLKFPLELD
jgi:hypothetical protein